MREKLIEILSKPIYPHELVDPMRLAENRVGDRVWIKVIGNIHDNPELLEDTQ
jgi:hypothetical protein